MPGGKTKSAEPVPPLTPAGTNPNINPLAPDQKPPQLDSVSQSQETPFQKSNPDTFFPAAAPQTDSATPPLLAPPVFSKQETLPALLTAEQHADVDPQFQIKNTVSDPSPSRRLAGPALDPSYTQDQHKTTRTPAPAPHSPQGPTAVWKKNQGKYIMFVGWYYHRLDSTLRWTSVTVVSVTILSLKTKRKKNTEQDFIGH